MAKKAYIGVDGKARKIKKGYIGAPTERYVGKKASEYAVGSSIYLSENGTNVEYLVVHQGLPSSMYDASCDGTWLLRKNAYETRAWHSTNSNNYKNSTINTYLNETYFNLFNANTKSAIKQAKIPYVNGTGNSAVASGSNGLSANVFLLGCYELGWTTSNNSYIPIDGACLSYFSGTAQTDTKRIGYFGADACDWWTRSTYTGNSRNAWYVYRLGSPSHDKVPNTFYVRPALIIDSNTAFDATTNTLSTTTETVPLARKIKKAYIGIGGVARPCWSGGKLAYYGEITEMSQSKGDFCGTTVGDYAVFGGGLGPSVASVDAYNKSLVRSNPNDLSVYRYTLAATFVGNYALFAGGRNSQGSYLSTADAYNTSLTRSTATSLSTGRSALAATAIGGYALFGGGTNGTNSAVVDTYNSSLTKGTATSLYNGSSNLAATTVGGYALFGGGTAAQVTAYNSSLTRTSVTSLGWAGRWLAATTVGNNAIFAGGFDGSSTMYTNAEAYNSSLTKNVLAALDDGRYTLRGASVGDYALFAGGRIYSNNVEFATVDVYDASLVKNPTLALGQQRSLLAAASFGDFALFAGGYGFYAYNPNVYAFTVA